MPGHDIIVIGASAGGVETLKPLVRALPRDIPAAVFIVLHVAATGPAYLARILAAATQLQVRFAEDGDAIEHGRIYVAPPDRHLLIEQGRARVLRGPKE